MSDEQPALILPRPPPGPERIALQEADPLVLWRGWLQDEDRIRSQLIADLPWQQHELRTPGGRVKAPRLECWFAVEAGRPYTYSGETYLSARMRDFEPLDQIRESVETVTGHRFDALFVNLYRSGRDSIGWHADDEPVLGPPEDVIIASLSLGARRTFAIRRNPRTTSDPHAAAERVSMPLGHGDLLLMGRRVQSAYLHEAPKTVRSLGPRLNLTFRRLDCR